jgi:hypothetical protein
MRLCRRVFQFVVSETEGGTLSALPCAQFSTLHDAGVSCPLPSQWRPEGFQLLPVENLLACTVYVACMDHLARTKTGFSKPRSSGRSVVWPISTDCSMLVFFFCLDYNFLLAIFISLKYSVHSHISITHINFVSLSQLYYFTLNYFKIYFIENKLEKIIA